MSHNSASLKQYFIYRIGYATREDFNKINENDQAKLNENYKAIIVSDEYRPSSPIKVNTFEIQNQLKII